MITVLFFGPVAERAGVNELQEPYRAGMRVDELRQTLAARYPEAFALVSLVAVDGRHQRDFSAPLADHSEVVFMSRFSGG